MTREGPKWGGDAFFRHEKTLPTFLAERILILRIFIFWIFWAPALGPTWVQLGPSLGPAWAQLGPSLGPAWAQLGPNLGPGVGPAWAQAAMK